MNKVSQSLHRKEILNVNDDKKQMEPEILE